MRIALDATYSVDKQPSGIAVYSREILSGLAAAHPEDLFVHCYRPKQYWQAPTAVTRNIRRRLLLPFPIRLHAEVFHALNQRVDQRPAKRVIATFHDLFVMTAEYSTPDFRRRFTEQARRAAQNSDLIITVSEFTASQVSTLLGFERSRIRVIPHGAHVAPQTASSEKMVLTVGAIQLRKNTARLVEAFESLPQDWRLVLAGAADGYGAAEILEKIRKSHCHERIRVTGYVSPEQLERLYSQAAIFALPSLDEGFGIPVLEAMAHGLPVVTSNCSALPEVAGEAAILIDPRRVDEIAMALRRLAENPDERTRLAALGRERAKLFSWSRAVEATYAVYREIVG